MTLDILAFLVSLTAQFATLAGVAGLVAALINILKAAGLVQDGTSERWKAGLSLAAFIIVALVGIFKPDLTAVILDEKAAQIATVLLFISGFLVQTGLTPVAHKILSGFPLIGTSFSNIKLNQLLNDPRGQGPKAQGMVEYSLILVLVAIVVIAALSIMGPLVADVFSTINQSL